LHLKDLELETFTALASGVEFVENDTVMCVCASSETQACKTSHKVQQAKKKQLTVVVIHIQSFHGPQTCSLHASKIDQYTTFSTPTIYSFLENRKLRTAKLATCERRKITLEMAQFKTIQQKNFPSQSHQNLTPLKVKVSQKSMSLGAIAITALRVVILQEEALVTTSPSSPFLAKVTFTTSVLFGP